MNEPQAPSACRQTASWVLRAAALALAVTALWGGVESSWMAVELMNQEWLHWFPVEIRRSSPHGPEWLLMESAGLGLVMCLIGHFLAWFALCGPDN
jgi:hypothetical protein